jgi:aryl-alcohol dehydrogenase-like predicted oxidoreductase
MGVIAKRPIANVAWRYTRRPESYYADYWQRLRKLDYPFLREGVRGSRAAGPPPSEDTTAVATALRFTLSVPGVHTAIVGTTKPERWQQNAALLGRGALPKAEFERIRARWRAVADASWEGQT